MKNVDPDRCVGCQLKYSTWPVLFVKLVQERLCIYRCLYSYSISYYTSGVLKFELGTEVRPCARAVASLMVPGGQNFHFPHFSSNFDQFDLFFLKIF